MAHDSQLAKRNSLVIPGGLLVFYSLLVVVYGEALRPAGATPCPDPGSLLASGVCYSIWKLALVPLLLGAGLLVGGLLAFPDKARSVESCLHSGTGVHFTFSLLLSWVALTLFGVLVFGVRQGLNDVIYTLSIRGTDYQLVFLLEILLVVALLAFVPFMALLLHQGRMRRRLFRILDEGDDGPLEAHALGQPHSQVGKAPLRDVTGTEGVYVNLDDEKP